MQILIVEDQLLIARQVEMIASAAGHSVVGIATTLGEACRLAIEAEPDIAFVDLSLADGVTGPAIGQFIHQNCKTKVVYTTANVRRLPEDFAGAFGVLEKPFTKGDLLSALAYLVAAIRGVHRPETISSRLRLPRTNLLVAEEIG
ncbi:response regulator [Aureimonas sp. Leaf454]|uniref:response regulator n=1 Tax=Aureimonas sp. Leaf454 TaxID=1736381 RepID=UPI00138F045B|nr:response regulator [Aureimonas sp. Leaf454]